MKHVFSAQEICPNASDYAANAREALERVCSGADLQAACRYYGANFVDHVNDREFRGLAGVAQSVAVYRRVLKDVRIEVLEQVTQESSVASRFLVRGTCLGRRVQFSGITISKFESGSIVEDWSVTDTLGMVRQLGVLRAAWVGLRTIGVYR